MKCSNPDCARGIGLVHYRGGWFSKRRYCSKNCRDAVVVIDRARQLRLEQNPTTYLDWLFGQPVLHAAGTGASRHPSALRAESEISVVGAVTNTARNEWRCEGWHAYVLNRGTPVTEESPSLDRLWRQRRSD